MLNTRITLMLTAALSCVKPTGSLNSNIGSPNMLNLQLASGTGAGKADQAFTGQFVLEAGASKTFNLNTFDGALDGVGNALNLACVKTMILQNLGSTDGQPLNEVDELILGGDGTAASWTSPFGGNNTATLACPSPMSATAAAPTVAIIAPGAKGFAVVPATNQNLKITNPTARPLKFNFYIIGATA